jgi:hypothetical protein
MTFHAGQKFAASEADQIGSTSFQFIGASQTSFPQNMTVTPTDLTGTSLTFTTQYSNTKVLVTAFFDISFTNNVDVGVTGANFIGVALVDGVSLGGTAEAHFNGVRGTIGQQWSPILPLAGSHTIKLRGSYFGPGPTGNIQTGQSTRWTAIVFGP